jgi:lipoprotein-anchoring transpeptidase ErfK/SrfK
MTPFAKAVVGILLIGVIGGGVFMFRDTIRDAVTSISSVVVEPVEELGVEAAPTTVIEGVAAALPPPVEISGEMTMKLALARQHLDEGDLVSALRLSENVLLDDTMVRYTGPWRKAADLADTIMSTIVMTDVPFPEKVRHVVGSGQSLSGIAQQYNVTVAMLQISNGLERTRPTIYPDQVFKIYEGHWRIEVSKSAFVLVLFDGERIVKVYDIATGRQDRTPVGTFIIKDKQIEPVWYPGGGRIIPFGEKENVLGTRWMGMRPTGDTDPTLKGFGIHGTWEPESIGNAASLGCVRMRNEDVEELFDFVTIGTPVTIIE